MRSLWRTAVEADGFTEGAASLASVSAATAM